MRQLANSIAIIIMICACAAFGQTNGQPKTPADTPLAGGAFELLTQSRAALEEFRFTQAKDLAEKALKIEPESIEARDVLRLVQQAREIIAEKKASEWLTHGRDFLALGQVSESIRYLSYAVETEPKNIPALTLRAQAFYKDKNFLRAAEDYSAVLAIDPSHLKSIMGRAIAYQQLKDFQKSLADCQTLITVTKNSPVALALRGEIRYEMKEYQTAIQDLNQALLLQKNLMEAQIRRARCHLELGQPAKALEDWNALIAANPQNIILYQYRAETYLLMKDWSQALTDADRLITMNPGYGQAYLIRADANLALGDRAKAIEDYERAEERLRGGPSEGVALNRLGELALEKQFLEEARDYFSRALKAFPEYSLARLNRAQCYAQLKKYAEGRADCEKIRKQLPTPPGDIVFRTVRLQALICGYEKKWTEAAELYQLALNTDKTDAFLYFGAAKSWINAEQFLKAQNILTQLKQAFPQDKGILEEAALTAAELALSQKDYAGALKYFDEAVLINVNSRATLLRMMLKIVSGNSADINKDTTDLLKIRPDDGYFILYKAAALTRSGKQKDAAKFLRSQALILDKNPWTTALGKYLRDAMDDKELEDSAREIFKNGQAAPTCEIMYFKGIRLLAEGNEEEARAAFEKCVETDCRDFFEYTFAKMELVRLVKP